MKRGVLLVFLVLLLLPVNPGSRGISVISVPTQMHGKLHATADLKGVVVIDDSHDNDYLNGNMDDIIPDLESLGFLVYYSSELGGFINALEHANYLIISAPYVNFTVEEIAAVQSWFNRTAGNILVASRGDYNDATRSSVNDMLSAVNVSLRLQDDNIYTTDPNAYREWYIYTDNIVNNTIPGLFDNVGVLNFFSPSSITTVNTSASDFLVYAEAEAYQTDKAGSPPPLTIYDDTPDGVGGDSIPLAGAEKIVIGNYSDRVIAVGTTLWSDYNYLRQDEYGNIPLLHNIMNYFYQETLAELGQIIITVPDTTIPTVKLTFPRNNSVVMGMINITASGYDKFGVAGYEIYINNSLRASTSYYYWNTSAETEAWYNITAVAYDDAGHSASVSHFVFVNQSFVPVLPSTFKFMTYNIKESGIKPQWLDVMKEENPDIVILVETGDFDDNNNSLLNYYLNELNSYFIDEVPYQGFTQQGAPEPYTGITILSRFNITEFHQISTLTLDSGSSFTPAHQFIHAVIDVHGTSINIIGAHLQAFAGATEEAQRAKEQEGINNYMDSLGEVPLIYAGDLNSESPQDSWNSDLGKEPVASLINPENPAAPKHHLFKDVYRMLHSEPGYTFGGYSRIDFIFANQFLWPLVTDSTVGDTPSALEGSDHLSVDALIDISQGVYTGPPSEPLSFTATYHNDTNTITLTWEKPVATFNQPISEYVITKYDASGNIVTTYTVSGDTFEFVDTDVALNNTYSIQAKTSYGYGDKAYVSLTVTLTPPSTNTTTTLPANTSTTSETQGGFLSVPLPSILLAMIMINVPFVSKRKRK